MSARRKLAAMMVAGLMPPLIVLAAAATSLADVPANVIAYNGAAKAAGVHLIVGTNQFPNFATGAVDNRFPLASAEQDASPSARANASGADYGPIGATVFSLDFPQPCSPPPIQLPLPPPPALLCKIVIPYPPHPAPPQVYAEAQYPNPPGKAHDAYSVTGLDHSEVAAGELSADASGTYGGSLGAPFSSASAEAHTVVNPDGSIQVRTHSHISAITLGPVSVSGVDVVTEVDAAPGRAPKAMAMINPGKLVNPTDPAHPIAITAAGITLPLPALPGNPVSIKVFALNPVTTQDGSSLRIQATGLHIVESFAGGIKIPGNPPSLDTEYILGEGDSQAFIVGGTPSTTTTDTSSTGSDSGSSASTTFDNSGSFTGAAPSDLLSSARRTPAVVRRLSPALRLTAFPIPLAYLFFLWEALVLAAAGAWVYRRRWEPAAP